MQDRFQLSQNGQELQQADVNLIAKEASLADDRVFAELLRLAPYNGTTYGKAILPYSPLAIGNSATVLPGTGVVAINPFRAIVGSRNAASAGALDNWQDVRSAVYTGSSIALQGTQSLAANASGQPRWDLVYVAVSSDANGASNTRYQKNTTTKVVTASSIVTTLTTGLAIGVQQGTPAATPTFPSLPSDTGTTIYIPLAFVRVINGFTAATVLNARDIYEVAPVTTISRATGASTLRPADQQYGVGGTAISGTGTSAIASNGTFAFSGTSNQRPAAYVPPSMAGSESLIIAIDLASSSSANWSHQNNAVVDASRDWRNRLFKWTVGIGSSNSNTGFPWFYQGSGAGLMVANSATPGYASSASVPAYVVGVGSSFFSGGTSLILTLQAGGAAATAAPAAGSNVATNAMTTATSVALVVDPTTGTIKLNVSGTPQCCFIVWLDASAPFINV